MVKLKQSSEKHFYRTEIDGLRALAVLAVITNHLREEILPGGYLGVDVFFVISGYVVTSSLVEKEISNVGNFLLNFYERRFRRLFPALSIVIIVSSLLACLFIVPYGYELSVSLRTATSALVGFSNVYLLRQNLNYFSDNASYNLFTHTWSLGVEEQFYLIFPILLILSWKIAGGKFDKTKLISFVLFPTVLSFTLYVYVYLFLNQSQAFFLMPTRFWEMGAGSLCFLSSSFFNKRIKSSKQKKILASISLIGILISFFSPVSWQLVSTISVVLLMALIILSVESSTYIFKFLTLGYLRTIGLVSYSLYLWHWPLIVLARWTVGLDLNSSLVLLILTGGMTALTYPIENYFRQSKIDSRYPNKSRNKIFKFILIISLLVLSLFLIDSRLKYFLYSGNKEVAINLPTNLMAVRGTSINSVNCFQNPDAPIDSSLFDKFCSPKIKPNSPTVYFIGDSHTHMLMPLAEKISIKYNVNIGVFSRGGCPFPYFDKISKSSIRPERYKLCPAFFEDRLQFLQNNLLSGDVLVLSNHLSGYFDSLDNEELKSYSQQISLIADKMSQKGVKLIIIAPVPSFDSFGWSEKAVSPALCAKEWFRPQPSHNYGCTPILASREQLVNKLEPIVQMLNNTKLIHSNLYVFNPFSSLCPPTDKYCSNFSGNYQLFVDSNHLSDFGARYLWKDFSSFLVTQRFFEKT